MKNKGITLIALVVTIIILLILAGVTISLIIGPDSIVEKAKETKIAGRYGDIMDKIYARDADLEIAFSIGETGEHQQDFINRMIAEKKILLNEGDDYDRTTYRKIYLGLQRDGSYKYTIDVADGTVKGKEIADAINSLPDADAPGNEHLKNMTLIVETTGPEQTVTLPINNTEGLTINWNVGDESSIFENPKNTSDPTYTYEIEGTYEIQISGVSAPDTKFQFGPMISSIKNNLQLELEPESKELISISETARTYTRKTTGKYNPYSAGYDLSPIITLKHWGENGFSSFIMQEIVRIEEIPLPSKNSFINVTDFSGTFAGNTSFKKIPESLFANCPNVTTFRSTFANCSNLEGAIPEGLFVNCPKVTDFSWTFESCSKLEGAIPESLFSKCPLVTSFSGTFASCSNLEGAIPESLFANCPLVTSFFDTFYSCSNLEGAIPENLFANCPLVTTFSYTFNSCSKLEGGIPESLFANCPKVTTFDYTFGYCSKLTGNAIPLWNTHSSATGTWCYRGCSKLTGYNDNAIIPAAWK